MLIRLNYGDPQLLADGWPISGGGRDRPGVTYINWEIVENVRRLMENS